MDNYILSLCIPTYNRHDILSDLLDKLIPQIRENGNKIQLCISDNCSTDKTADLIRDFAERFSFVDININTHNYGYDYNLCRVIDMAKSDYIWTFSDDDIILLNGIKEILNIIEEFSDKGLAVIYAKPKFVHKDKIVKNETYQLIDHSINDKIYNNSDEFLIDISWIVTFVSSFIFKKVYIPKNLGEFMGTGFIHTPIILNSIKNGTILIATGKTIVLSRQGNGVDIIFISILEQIFIVFSNIM